MPRRLLSFAIYVLPLLLWMGLMFSLSTNKASAQATNPAVNGLLRHLLPGIIPYLTASQIDSIDFDLRKTAHVTEYTILSLLACRAVRFGRQDFRAFMAYGPLLIGVLFAASDEYHQSFYAQRGATTTDVFIDSFGVLVGLFLFLWATCARLSRRPSQSREASTTATVSS